MYEVTVTYINASIFTEKGDEEYDVVCYSAESLGQAANILDSLSCVDSVSIVRL